LGAQSAPHFFSAATDVRDRAQADNLDWIVTREGPSGKLLIFGARYHLSATPLKARFNPGGEEHVQEVAGIYLRRRLGDGLITIGNLIGEGDAACGKYEERLGRAPADSMDGFAAEVGTPLFLLDLRSAPAPVARWFNQEHSLVAGCQTLQLAVGKAFDILFYIDTVTPARVEPCV
jgi:erythromycin esterase-like protein